MSGAFHVKPLWKPGGCAPARPPTGSTIRSTAKGSQQHLDPIKQLLITANVEQDNEGRPGSAQQSDNREVMTSVAPFGL